MGLRLISTPLTRDQKLTVVSVPEAKMQARITTAADDDLVAGYIETAYDFLSGPNGWLNGYCLLEETYEFTGEPQREGEHLRFRVGRWKNLEFPLRPCNGFESIEYASDAETYAVVPSTDVRTIPMDGGMLAARFSYIAPIYGTSDYGVRIVAKAGHTDAATIPSPLKQTIKMLVGEMYKNREVSTTATAQRVMLGLGALAGRYRFEPDHS